MLRLGKKGTTIRCWKYFSFTARSHFFSVTFKMKMVKINIIPLGTPTKLCLKYLYHSKKYIWESSNQVKWKGNPSIVVMQAGSFQIVKNWPSMASQGGWLISSDTKRMFRCEKKRNKKLIKMALQRKKGRNLTFKHCSYGEMERWERNGSLILILSGFWTSI